MIVEHLKENSFSDIMTSTVKQCFEREETLWIIIKLKDNALFHGINQHFKSRIFIRVYTIRTNDDSHLQAMRSLWKKILSAEMAWKIKEFLCVSCVAFNVNVVMYHPSLCLSVTWMLAIWRSINLFMNKWIRIQSFIIFRHISLPRREFSCLRIESKMGNNEDGVANEEQE